MGSWCHDRVLGSWVFWRRDMTFCVATAALQCETEVYRDRVGSFGVATYFVGVAIGPSWLGGVATESALSAHDSAHSALETRQCCLVAHCIVLCNCLNYNALALFMNTVHRHC